MPKREFISLVSKYSTDSHLANKLWQQIEDAYNDDERYFHNLKHLELMFGELLPVQTKIEDWDSILFALVYHDIVYDVVQYMTENDNEEKSVGVAEDALSSINYPTEKMERVKQYILATKKHQLSNDSDTNFFTDADLSILGQPWEVYAEYMKNIYREYAIFPQGIYNAGRIKVLKKFLQMERLFKTDHFFHLYEAAAKENMERELEILSFR